MSSDDNTPGAHYAVGRTSGKPFIAAGARISIENPHVSGSQYSAARIKLRNGPDSVEVGWRVDPTLHGDTHTRRFIRFDAGQSHCFNIRCPGFVLVRSDMQIERVYYNSNKPYEPVEYFTVPAYIERDKVNGNWWLLLESAQTPVGFWPKQLFTGLGNLANSVEWGGEVFSPSGTRPPPMGRGFLVTGNPNVDAFFEQIAVLNEFGQTVDPDNIEEFADDKKLYIARDKGIKGGVFGHVVVYGPSIHI
ncbi:hypothetical protein C3L33_12566, partial [Rhododendron williamsianum]